MGDQSHAIESEDKGRDIIGAENQTEVFHSAIHPSTHDLVAGDLSAGCSNITTMKSFSVAVTNII